MADLTGQRLSQYLILERISKGATSTVYKAYQEKLERYVAVKVLSPHFIDEEGFLERFKQDVQRLELELDKLLRVLPARRNTPELLRRIRGHANFIESVPIALIILIMMEVLGASDTWLHAVGATLVAGRVLHYLGMTELGPFICRPAGMVATNLVYLVGSVWILVDLFA